MDQALFIYHLVASHKKAMKEIVSSPLVYTAGNRRDVAEHLAPGEAAGIQAIWFRLPPSHPPHLHITLCNPRCGRWNGILSMVEAACSVLYTCDLWAPQQHRKDGLLSPYCPANVEAETHGGEGICPASHRWYEKEPEFKWHPSDPKPSLLDGPWGLQRCPGQLLLRSLYSINIMTSFPLGKAFWNQQRLWSRLLLLLPNDTTSSGR